MRGNKILVCLAFLLAFVIGISAQEKTTQNEISIEKLLRLEDVTTLRFLVSTKEDVKALYGEACGDYICRYTNDWTISFEYVGNILDFYLSNPTPNGIGRMDRTFIKPEFKGTLKTVLLANRRYVFPENYSLPPDFDCTEIRSLIYCNNGETFIRYGESDFKSRAEKDIPVKNIGILHRVSITQFKQITGETELQRTPPQQKKIPPDEPRF